MKLCDRVTVLRHGRVIGTDDVSNLTTSAIARMMVGRDVILKIDKIAPQQQEKVVKVRDLVYINQDGRRVVSRISFDLYAGEILGIAGIEGNGQNEITGLLCGMLPILSGLVEIKGASIAKKSIHAIRDLGVAVINEDRMLHGCAPDLSVKENILAAKLRTAQFRKGPFLNHKKANVFVDRCISDFDIRCDHRSVPVKMLSGGNVQKVIVAREFTSGANLIIANQPTRGIDIGTSEMIRKHLIRKTREENVAVLLVSSDLNEILEVSDRLIVIKSGRIAAHFPDASQVDEETLGEYMLGVRNMSPAELEMGSYEYQPCEAY